MKIKILLFFLTGLYSLNFINAQEESRLLRFPATNDKEIAFSYAGDLYVVSIDGGVARRITSNDGYEMFPRFSPDGNYIAFTGQYDGNTEVFIIPSEGGTPRRLTYTATLGRDDVSDRMGPNNIVMAWTPDGKYITYRSRQKSFNDFIGQLFNVPVEGGLSTELPLPTGGFCSWSPDGNRLAYNRIFREFRTWKYYRGGMVDEIWLHDFRDQKTIKITDNDSQDIIPMWTGDWIFFLSDRDRIMNLFAYNFISGKTEKVTDFTEYDIKFPSLGKDHIVFENGGYIYKLDIHTRECNKVTVIINNDYPFSRPEYKDASKSISSYDVSPNGERVVLGARGDVFSLPARNGITINYTKTSGAHERDVHWSPDGRYISYFSDATGEYELYIRKQDGSEDPIRVTYGINNYPYYMKWSPDSKKIVFSDRDFRLQYVDITTKKLTLVRKSPTSEIRSFDWSPDSKWIAYTEAADNQFNIIYLYQLESKNIYPVTDNWYTSSNPAFSPDGKYLYFVSDRDFNPVYSRTEWNHSYSDMSRLYLVTLAKSTPSPLALENDIVTIIPEEVVKDSGKKEKEETKDKGANKDKEPVRTDTKIDTDGLQSRIIALPVSPANYVNLQPVNDRIYYNRFISGPRSGSAYIFDLKTIKETELGSGLRFRIASGMKKMLVVKEGKYAVIDLPQANVELKETIDLSNMMVKVDFREEWKQIFDESWRQMRDFFYAPNMHGLDWKAIHDKYSVLLPYVNHRHDLTYIIGEMIGELSAGHTYVSSGPEAPTPERISTGLLGAELSKHQSGYFCIDKILDGANWSARWRSPLRDVGVDVNEKDFIIAVNGESTANMSDIYVSLLNTAGKTIELTVNSKPSPEGARKVLVKPLDSEADLYYYNWVQNNIKKVDEATNGQVGYIYIPDMLANGLNEFAKYFYPQLNKKGLIIDGRGNGGGNVSPMIIERLRREMVMSEMMRGYEEGRTVPEATFHGPMVLLINYASASDGDLFPYQFKTLGLGTIIGTRTWGGVVGIRGTLPFIDGGILNKPEFAHYSAEESKWVIEGHGVDPDIYVDNDPSLEYAGKDQQLEKAIEVIMEQLDQYKPVPPIPEFPDKSK
jgi:tricorn protease